MKAPRAKLVLLDDDSLCIESLRLVLGKSFDLVGFHLPSEATHWIEKNRPQIAILDLHLKEGTAFSLIEQWKKRFPQMEIIICSGEKNVELAIECMRLGAIDYVLKPYTSSELQLKVQRALDKQQLKSQIEKMEPLLFPQPIQYVAESKAMRDIENKIRLIKGHTHLNIMILGESGTGKEIVARLLHQQEENPERPLVICNMPAIAPSLIESELFGVEKGAFTDAKNSRAGKFELADQGDIFLDEIGDLPYELQSKLLRVLQEKQVERVGSTYSRNLNFRVISATNQPLADLMKNGRFREDLIYRLSDLVLWLPPLRERKEDIPLLVNHFIKKYSRSGDVPTLSQRALDQLVQYHWPGNIRELESTIKRSLIFNEGPTLETVDVYDPTLLTASPNSSDFDTQMRHFEKRTLVEAIQKSHGDKAAAMALLNLPKATFYRKLQELQIS